MARYHVQIKIAERNLETSSLENKNSIEDIEDGSYAHPSLKRVVNANNKRTFLVLKSKVQPGEKFFDMS